MKVLALGFGLKSGALTLNLVETLDVGVCTPLDEVEGPVGGGIRMS